MYLKLYFFLSKYTQHLRTQQFLPSLSLSLSHFIFPVYFLLRHLLSFLFFFIYLREPPLTKEKWTKKTHLKVKKRAKKKASHLSFCLSFSLPLFENYQNVQNYAKNSTKIHICSAKHCFENFFLIFQTHFSSSLLEVQIKTPKIFFLFIISALFIYKNYKLFLIVFFSIVFQYIFSLKLLCFFKSFVLFFLFMFFKVFCCDVFQLFHLTPLKSFV